MNWETTYRETGASSLLQTATELQLIVLLFSVITPALQLGFGGRKFRHWVEVALSLLLVGINIYMYILICWNNSAKAWENSCCLCHYSVRGRASKGKVFKHAFIPWQRWLQNLEMYGLKLKYAMFFWFCLWTTLSGFLAAQERKRAGTYTQ